MTICTKCKKKIKKRTCYYAAKAMCKDCFERTRYQNKPAGKQRCKRCTSWISKDNKSGYCFLCGVQLGLRSGSHYRAIKNANLRTSEVGQ